MPPLSQLSIALRNILIRRHSYFTCCASCGDIAVPVEGRLCTSLKPRFPVSAIQVGQAHDKQHVTDCMPWLANIRSLESEGVDLWGNLAGSGVEPGYYLIIEKHSVLPGSRLVCDYFSPNGIPLIYMDAETGLPDVHMPYGTHSDLAVEYWRYRGQVGAASKDYRQWAVQTGKAVPVVKWWAE